MFLGKRSQTVAVEDCNDDVNDGVGKGNLRELGAFGNSSECI